MNIYSFSLLITYCICVINFYLINDEKPGTRFPAFSSVLKEHIMFIYPAVPLLPTDGDARLTRMKVIKEKRMGNTTVCIPSAFGYKRSNRI